MLLFGNPGHCDTGSGALGWCIRPPIPGRVDTMFVFAPARNGRSAGDGRRRREGKPAQEAVGELAALPVVGDWRLGDVERRGPQAHHDRRRRHRRHGAQPHLLLQRPLRRQSGGHDLPLSLPPARMDPRQPAQDHPSRVGCAPHRVGAGRGLRLELHLHRFVGDERHQRRAARSHRATAPARSRHARARGAHEFLGRHRLSRRPRWRQPDAAYCSR